MSITGIVKKRSGETLVIFDSESGTKIKVTVKEDLLYYILPGDAISINVDKKSKKVVEGIVVYKTKVTERAFVHPSTNKFQIIKVMANCLVGDISYLEACKKARYFIDKIENPVDYLTRCASLYAASRDHGLLETMAVNGDLTREEARFILIAWKKYFLLRRLYLLGIGKKIVSEALAHGHTLVSLYDDAIRYPYGVLQFDSKMISAITKVLSTHDEFTQKDITISSILRRVYLYTKKFKLSAITLGKLKSGFGLTCIDEIKIYMKEKFNCDFLNDKYLLLRHIAAQRQVIVGFLTRFEPPTTVIVPDEKKFSDLDKDQMKAMILAGKKSIATITGPAGTGKTTLIINLHQMFSSHKQSVYILAFTGKAVSRIKECFTDKQTNTENIMTIHRFMPSIKNKVDIIIVDESSMIGSTLLTSLIKAVYLLPNRPRMYFVGDPEQLQPIDYGLPFLAMLDKKSKIPTTALSIDHRRSKDTPTMYNALCLVREGKLLNVQEGDYTFTKTRGGLKYIRNLIKTYHAHGISSDDIAVIVPFNKLIPKINQMFVEIYVSENKSMKDSFGNVWYVGGRVMMLENRYDINVMNGEEGKIISVTKHDIKVKFKNTTVDIPGNADKSKDIKQDIYEIEKSKDKKLDTRGIASSWCVTVHKAQGSEWEYTIAYIQSTFFITREMIYVAISRAKKRLDFLYEGDIEELKHKISKKMKLGSDEIFIPC
uniref:RecD helicase /ATP-dependent exoDNAse n=1 Tax=Pithovirus LCDPAC01 TaxID=2506600 RepID=A0A481YNH7_9VIRU|nr:MAG: RecD helicase /ATP-dependent exoDNAse [Pithovirus LCDPAC01]